MRQPSSYQSGLPLPAHEEKSLAGDHAPTHGERAADHARTSLGAMSERIKSVAGGDAQTVLMAKERRLRARRGRVESAVTGDVDG